MQQYAPPTVQNSSRTAAVKHRMGWPIPTFVLRARPPVAKEKLSSSSMPTRPNASAKCARQVSSNRSRNGEEGGGGEGGGGGDGGGEGGGRGGGLGGGGDGGGCDGGGEGGGVGGEGGGEGGTRKRMLAPMWGLASSIRSSKQRMGTVADTHP